MFTTVNNVSPDDFDAAAQEAWINVTAASVPSMPSESIKIISVEAFNASAVSQSERRKLIQENVSTVITMTVQDIMETYQYNDAAEFTEFLQTSILESYSKPETIAVFVDLAASKGSSTITQDTLDVMNVEGVTFTEPEVSRVLSGTPTSAPTTEEKPLSLFEKIMKDKIRFSFSIVGFVLLCLCVVWIIYRHRRQKKTEMDQTEEDYKNKLKNTENNNSLFINVKFGDANYNDDKVDEVKEGNLVKEKIIDEKAVLSLSKFDSMMNKSFKGFVTEVDDVAPPSPSPLRSTMSKTPRMKIKKVKSPPLTESKSNFNTPSLRMKLLNLTLGQPWHTQQRLWTPLV